MPALVITAANVGADQGATIGASPVQVGEAVTQGETGRLDSDDGKYYLARNATADEADASVIFLTAAAPDGWAVVLVRGKYIVGATVAVGTTYVVGDNDGEINPIGDLGTGDFNTILGTADTTTTIDFQPRASGVDVP